MRSIKKYLLWLWRYSRGMRLPLVLNVLMGCFSIGLNLYFIYLTKRLVDMATGSVSVEGGTLIATGAIIIAVMLLRLAVNAYDTRLESITYSRLNFNIRQRLYSNLLQNRWMGKEKMHSGDTLNRLFSDVDQVTRMICQELPSMFTTLFQLVAAFIFLSSMDLRLALVLLLMTPVFLAFSKVFFRRIRTLTKDIRESESRVQSHIQESLQHKTVIQSMEVGARMENQLDDIQETEYGQVVRRTNLNVFARTLVSLAFSAGYVAALLWGVKGIYDGVLTFGVLTAFLQLVGQIQGPSVRLTHQIPGFIYATASIDRLAELEDAPKEEKGPSRMLAGIGGVRIENLTFRYPDGTEDVLHDFNYDFKPGTRTSIEGETGIGKSTLIRLMLSLLQPSSGQIFIYDDKQRLVSSALTRANLVYVPQGNSLFSGSIRDNLLLGNPEADEEQMWHVLDVAQAGFVRDLPQGLDTLCGEQGAGLSEGQAQRIAIARGLLRPGSIMLLDEFSSSLDPATESRLMENLCSDYKGKTMIFITHREKISRWCDAVLKLSEASSTCAPQGPSAQ